MNLFRIFIMRFSFIFSLCCIGVSLMTAEEVKSQEKRDTHLNFSMTKSTVVSVIEAISRQTGYEFIYDEALLSQLEPITLKMKDATLQQLLDQVSKQTKLGFQKVNDFYTVIPPAPPANTEKSEAKVQQGIRVTGIVSDIFGEVLPGVTILVRGTSTGINTDTNGEFSLTVPSDTSVLIFSYIGYKTQEVLVGPRRIIAVTMQDDVAELGEVTVVAFGTQKKESVVSSIQTVNTRELTVPSSNLTTAFAGRIAGMISYQTSGEPGFDNASFFIRGITTFGTGKVDPLILVDNVEVTANDLSNLHPDDLASFSILKDATATALYGARGANGVILISTKEGREGPVKVSIRMENSFSSPTDLIEMADPITYMYANNEASLTRLGLSLYLPYDDYKIDNTIRGTNPYVYPAVDWTDMLIKKYTTNQRVNLSLSGGGNIARYYVAGSYSHDNGILKVDKRNNFNNNINYNKYLLHSNININLTKTTELVVRLHGTFNDYKGPLTGGSDLYRKILHVSPVDFPAYYEPDEYYRETHHILFGSMLLGTTPFLNPYAQMLRGYQVQSNSTMMAQMEINQNFDGWIKGLKGRLMGNTQRYAGFNMSMAYSPFYYQVESYDNISDVYSLFELNPASGTEYLSYYPGGKDVSYNLYAEGMLNYSRIFGVKHDVSGMVVGIIRHAQYANPSSLVDALPNRNLGISGRFTYGYDSRYFAEFNFGYNGTEKFDKKHRWGFFPSFGIGWNVSNESFWLDNMKKHISKFRIRGTYGLVGNDAIGNSRFFYISEVIPGGGGNFRTGIDPGMFSRTGYAIRTYPNPNITWEVAHKSNLGIELALFDGKVEILTDFFHERRGNILQTQSNFTLEQGLWASPLINIGKAQGKGIDTSVDYQHSFSKDFWIVGRGNFTFARSTFEYFDDVPWDLIGAPWRMRKGWPVNQPYGWIAERLFVDDHDVESSALQFADYAAGDIKYMDLNNDGVIDDLDIAPIGYPTVPEINYGFGLSANYKNIDLSFFFSGTARSSFFINPSAMAPFIRRNEGDGVMNGGLAKFIADDHWTEQSQNPYAIWPRLSTTQIDNNIRTSTWWMRDGRFLRLKSVELGYSLPQNLTGKLGMHSLRLYFSGTNLLLFSKFKLWDVELGGNGLNYPLQRVFNVGIDLSF